MYCPECEDAQPEMNEWRHYESDTMRMEISMECVNPLCPVRFYGIMYKSSKPLEDPTPDEAGKDG